MADYWVTRVRMEWSDQGGRHEHIQGVCTSDDRYSPRRQVVDSLGFGDAWRTLAADGTSATIRESSYCKHADCFATPYITMNADASASNNLDNLPRC